MTSKHKEMNHNDVSIDLISTELQNNNHHAVLEIYKLIVQQNNTLKSCLNQINNDIENVKNASDELTNKLNKLQQTYDHNHVSTSLVQEIMDINREISHHSTNMMNNVHNNNMKSNSPSQQNGNMYHDLESNCRGSIDAAFDCSSSAATHNNNNNNNIEENTVNDHDLSRLIRNIESSEKTDYFDESSIKTDSITFVTDEHQLSQNAGSQSHTSNFSDDTMHHLQNLNGSNFKRQSSDRQKKHKKRKKHNKKSRKQRHKKHKHNKSEDEKSLLSQHGSPQEIVSKLESDGRLLALIEKSETKRVSRKKMTKFLQRKGVNLHKIKAAYDKYYKEHNLYEIVFKSHISQASGFGVTADAKGENAIIIWIEDTDLIRSGMKTGSIMYEINGKRVDHKAHTDIIHILHAQKCPFYVIFEHIFEHNNNNDNHSPSKKVSLPLHEHSMITSITRSKEDGTIEDVVSRIEIDWEQIGQILLDARFLTNARLINQALDHLETFCADEDVDENNWRDEICKAWSVTDDRGILLWQILSRTLGYSEDERRCFYDLILHFYFKLNDMKTVNIVFLCTKILRDFSQKVDLVKMKEILAINKVDGFSFNAEIKNALHFADLFSAMQNVENNVWQRVYFELTQWKLDEKIRNKHKKHQAKYKNRLMEAKDREEENNVSTNEITIFNDITRVSIRNDIDYSNSQEKKEWKLYRHNLKNVFIAFAGYKSSQMNKRELRRFLDIFDIGQFWSMHLMQQDIITMDEFIKYLCCEYINGATRDIKKYIEKLPQWTLFINAVKFLDDYDADREEELDGVLQYAEFERFAENLSLNKLETEILFNKIDADQDGVIHINDVFEWLKKKLHQKHCATKNNKQEKKLQTTTMI